MNRFEKHVETTDMQVSRLSNPVRSCPWDQLLKVGLDETMTRCQGALDEENNDAAVGASVDNYRSAACAQLESLEAGIRNAFKGKRSRHSDSPTVFSFRETDDEPVAQSTSIGRGARTRAELVITKCAKAVLTSRG